MPSFKLLDQLQSSVDSINNFDVVNVTNLKT